MAAQLIAALDLPRKEDALVLARELQGAVPWCKVGMELFTLAGPDIIRELHKAGTTILLVEQNAQMALSVADRAYVLETGRISLSGTGAELAASDEVRKAYLGG